MATQSVTLQELDKRLRKVEQQVAEFKRSSHRKSGVAGARATRRKPAKAGSALDIAQRAGMLVELPLEARARVERWRAMPEDEREHILDEFFNLQLDRPLSDIIIENRQ